MQELKVTEQFLMTLILFYGQRTRTNGKNYGYYITTRQNSLHNTYLTYYDLERLQQIFLNNLPKEKHTR
jgi:hypothetical protein